MGLLKDINNNESTAYIDKRENFKKFIPKSLLKAVLYLYDLNVRTVSCGSANDGELGISVDYDSLSEQNKQIADNYMKANNCELTKPCTHMSYREFRIFVNLNLKQTTIKQAEKLIYEQVQKVGLVQQDVLFGFSTLEEKHKLYSLGGVNLTKEELIEMLQEISCFIDRDIVWENEELYQKHMEFLNNNNEIITT